LGGDILMSRLHLRTRVVGVVAGLFVASCASLWGFQDGTLANDGGTDGRVSGQDGGRDVTTAHDAGGDARDAPRDTASSADTSRADGAIDAAGDAPRDAARCTTAEDCPAGQACDTQSGLCGNACGTTSTTECRGGCCGGGRCQPGTTDMYCIANGTCQTCSAPTPACAGDAGCVECVTPMDCMGVAGKPACVGNSCSPTCAEDIDCPVGQACAAGNCPGDSCHAGPFMCGPSCSGSCNAGCCGMNAMCAPGTAPGTCGVDGGACAICAGTTAQCSSGGVCVECNTAADCTGGGGGTQSCVNGVCMANGSCATANECNMGYACNAGTCSKTCTDSTTCNGGCCASGTCASYGPMTCGGGTGAACVDCMTGTSGKVCVMTGVCGCNMTSDCTAGTCNMTTHVCM